MDLQYLLKSFQSKFEIPKGEFEPKFLNERLSMLTEEVMEISFAIDKNNPEGVLDGLVDLVYFAIGTATLLDYDFNEAFRRVHEANMQKVRSYTERTAVDLVKPPGWKSPDLSDLV
jgi:NTP pyrophosphatase (non-canonical NTP hydrolase)